MVDAGVVMRHSPVFFTEHTTGKRSMFLENSGLAFIVQPQSHTSSHKGLLSGWDTPCVGVISGSKVAKIVLKDNIATGKTP